ncbi:hypothetical protein V1478_012157 [Vespula squamosa]|uniref:Uncharacterized protein n=1 Tax=Vespula squamosa TaxID=30214 RepID=A0ABD2AD06_VESSQ
MNVRVHNVAITRCREFPGKVYLKDSLKLFPIPYLVTYGVDTWERRFARYRPGHDVEGTSLVTLVSAASAVGFLRDVRTRSVRLQGLHYASETDYIVP